MGTAERAKGGEESSPPPLGRVRRQSGRSTKALASQAEVIAAAEDDKAEGTRLFQEGKYFEAFEVWKQSVDAFEAELEELSPAAVKLYVALCCNAAQALLKCPEVEGAATEGACAMAGRALELEPSNVKALFRRGCSYANARNWRFAQMDFQRILQLEPRNEAARTELLKVEEASRGSPGAQVPGEAEQQRPRVDDPEEVVRVAQQDMEQLRREILAAADRAGSVSEWCKRFNKVQVVASAWVKHQLEDLEMLEDLKLMWRPVFASMTPEQQETFLSAREFVSSLREHHGEEIDRLLQPSE